MVEGLQRTAQTTVRPSFLLLDTGSGQGGLSVPRVQVLNLDGRRRVQVDCDSHQLVSGEMQGSLLPFPAQKQVFMLFLPVILLNLKVQTHVSLCGMIDEDVEDLKAVHDV